MMKRILVGIIALCQSLFMTYADDGLPLHYSIVVGGGLSIPSVDSYRNSFFQKNGNRLGYNLMTEGRYYFHPNIGIGVQYDYVNATCHSDKMHTHFVRPNLILRHLWSNGNQGAFLLLGIGYMDYQERTYAHDAARGTHFQHGYCGISLGIGHEFRIAKGISGMYRMDLLTADWFVNPDARIFNYTGYDDDINHSWFKNNVSFINITIALQFGK